MSKRRKNAGEGYGFMFSGAYSEKKDAVAKEKKRKGSFIKGMPTKHGYRYVVMTPRTNPIKRKRHNASSADREKSIAITNKNLEMERYLEQAARNQIAEWSSYQGRGRGRALRSAEKHLREHQKRIAFFEKQLAKLQAEYGSRENSVAWGKTAHAYQERDNPSELLVMGANPHENIQEITLEPGSKLIIRNNPAELRHNEDSSYMFAAAQQLYPGRDLRTLTARELSQVAQLAARLKHPSRTNSLGTFFGFSPRHAPKKEWVPSMFDRSRKAEKQRAKLAAKKRKQELHKSKMEFRERVRAKRQEIKRQRADEKRRQREERGTRGHRGTSRSSGASRSLRADVASALVNQGYKPAQARRMAREASGSDFSSMFHDALRQNPMCGAMVQGYACMRKPGHKGPHLPQGATMRTRHRLPQKWQPNPSAEALRERFTGAPAEHVRVMDEPHMSAGNYAMLGKLLSLYVKPRKGGQVQEIRAAGGTMVVADESARQIYFVGGDQDISSGLAVFGAVDRGAGLFEIGEARRIDYKQRKEHVEHPEQDSWRHEFGEETGKRPTVLYDLKAKRLLLEGGDYRVEEAGIIN